MRGRVLARTLAIALLATALAPVALAQQKRIYIANDDHTDYMWKGTEAQYRVAFVSMLDYYLNLTDTTIGNPSPYQSRFNTDGTFWIRTYEQNKTPAEYDRLVGRIQSGHIGVPLNTLVQTYGAQPTEAVLRGMYYAGLLERRHNFRISLVEAMENQTLPLGLGGLWTGAGAKYSWRGVCGCATNVPGLQNRAREIYKWNNLDGSTLLMKWNSLITGNSQAIGGYAEARNPSSIVTYVDGDATYNAKWPYLVRGAFGYGWDDLQTTTNTFPTVAQSMTNAGRQVIVSNEVDFFQDFEGTSDYANLPLVRESYGNEWDTYSASMVEVSAKVRRSAEKLRAAEGLATLASLKDGTFWSGRKASRDQAMVDLGVYWEHSWTADGDVPKSERAAWQRSVATEIATYVDTLLTDAVAAVGGYIPKPGGTERFFVFNPLSWTRDDMADIPRTNGGPVHVVDVSTGQDVPSQFVTVDGQSRLRILATGVPSLGYKVYEVQAGPGTSFTNAATVAGSMVENSLYQVTLDGRGAITSLVDKTRGNLQLAKNVGGRVINDLGGSGGTVVTESIGPVSVTLKATSSSPLDHESRVTFIRNSDRIDIRNDITENFGNVLTWAFGFEMASPEVRHEELGAVLTAKLTSNGGHYATQNARYQWLTLNHFADMIDTAAGTQVGITLSNADLSFMRLGSSINTSLDTTTPQISVLAGGQVDGTTLGILNQGGDTQFRQRFALRSHGAYDETAAMRFSLEHQNPLVTGTVTGGTGYPADSYSFASLSRSNAFLWALKPAEDGIDQGVVARIWDMNGGAALSLSLASGINTADTLTHIETPTGSAPVSNGALNVPTNAGLPRIVTHRVHPGTLTLSIADAAPVTEGNSGTVNASFAVTLSASSITTVKVDYATADSTATVANNDYTATSGTLTFPPGTVTQTITVPVKGDIAVEPNETFLVNLTNPSAASLGDSQGVGTITNDDSAASGKAEMQTPVPGSTLAGASVTFTWSAGSGTPYWLEVGTTPGGKQISAGSQIATLSTTVNGIPTNSSTIYTRLWTRLNNVWVYNDYTYTAAGAAGAGKAVMQTPTPGSILPGPTVTFTWNAGGGTPYWLEVGTTPGGRQISTGSQITTLSTTVNGIPTNGSAIYARLWTFLNNAWVFNDYTYTAAGAAGSGKAVMQTPNPGSTLPGATVTFTWNAGGGTPYWLEVGTTPGGKQISAGSQITTLSTTVNGIPTNGSAIYARLWTFLNNAWVFNDYTYTAAGAAGSGKAVMQTPNPGSTLPGATVTFTWNAGGGTAYWLEVGTTPGGKQISVGSQITTLSTTVNGIPTGSVPIYTRLWTLLSGAWVFNDYTYTAAP